jgi:hypothetical protein
MKSPLALERGPRRALRYASPQIREESAMNDAYVVQKLEWYQLRSQDGSAFFVMVSTLPNGFVTAVPCDLTMVRADHHLMALAPNAEDALAQLQTTLAGKTREELFPSS